MTGTEKSGPKAAIDNLYEGKTVVLCDLEDNEELHKSRAFEIFQAIGMRVVTMNSNNMIFMLVICLISHIFYRFLLQIQLWDMKIQNQ